jgi:hypothetical protein
MTTKSRSPSRTEVLDEVSKWAVGGGIVTVALFPLALPILLLTAVAVLALLLPALAAGVLVAVVALPVLAARSIGRRVRRAARPASAAPKRIHPRRSESRA